MNGGRLRNFTVEHPVAGSGLSVSIVRSNLLFDDPPCWDAPERRPEIWGPPVNWYSRGPDSNSLSGKSPRGIPIADPIWIAKRFDRTRYKTLAFVKRFLSL